MDNIDTKTYSARAYEYAQANPAIILILFCVIVILCLVYYYGSVTFRGIKESINGLATKMQELIDKIEMKQNKNALTQ